MERLARLAGRALLFAGWFAFAAVVVLYGAESSGALNALVRELLASKLGALGPELTIASTRLRWFEPAIELDGVEIGPRAEALRLDSVRVELEMLRGPLIRAPRIEIDGGRVRIAPALLNGLEGLLEGSGPRRERAWMPTLCVRGVHVDWDTRPVGRVPLGRVELYLRSGEDRTPVLTGRLVPTLAVAAGTPGEIYLHGREAQLGEFEVVASAARLPIDFEAVPLGTFLDDWRFVRPSGELALEARGGLSIRDGFALRPGARLRLHWTNGSFRAAAGKQRFDEIEGDVDLEYRPPTHEARASNLRQWRGRAQLTGEFDGAPFALRAEQTESAKCWLDMDAFPLDERVLQLGGDQAKVRRQWDSFEPHGRARVCAALALSASWDGVAPLSSALSFGLWSEFDGQAGIVYRGWPSARTGQRDQGFPLPLDGVTGEVVCAYDPQRLRPLLCGLVGLSGANAAGTRVRAHGVIAAHPVDLPPYAPGYGYGEFDLQLDSERLPVDDELRNALLGLSDILHPDETWRAFRPDGGALRASVRLARTADKRYAAAHVELGLTGVDVAWNACPLPVHIANGRFEFLSDGARDRGISCAIEGTLATAQRLVLSARLQTDPAVEAGEGMKRLDQIEHFAVHAERFSLTGDDKQILVTQFPAIGQAMDEFLPRGFVDIDYARTRASAAGAFETEIEIAPQGPVQLSPADFKMVTSDVHGRVLVSVREFAGEKALTRTRLAPIVGAWGPDVQVAFTASFPDAPLVFYGAGIDPTNKSLLGSLATSMRAPGAADFDINALRVDGRLDLRAEFAPRSAEQPSGDIRARIYLRDNSLASGEDFRLDRLQGVLDWHERELTATRLAARIANTPVELSNARFESDAQGFRLRLGLSAENLRCDREHLRCFLNAATVDALVGDLQLDGWMDIENGEVGLSNSPQGGTKVEFRGKVTPSDLSIQLGLPFSIRSATAQIEGLVLEGGRVRSWGRLSDLYGELARRNLGPADLLFTYVEPRLSIEDLSGQFEGGRIQPLGGDASRGGTVFSIDLEKPYPFQLALDLQSVSVAGLLGDLFPSSVATKGLLSCQMRLTGNTENLLGIAGSGSVLLRESRLWSIPVFRELFSLLGLDNTAVFDRMATNFRVKDGAVRMNDIAARSPIFQLVGKGVVDFDGRLKHDLEVRYDLVDRLGPFARLLYAIQNELLAVAIRGDMSRPQVILKYPLQRLLSSGSESYRALPLPALSPLPPRF